MGNYQIVVSRKRQIDIPEGMELVFVRQDERWIIFAGMRENASQQV